MVRSVDYRERKTWPPLAWVACVPRDGGPVVVEHGAGVETRDDWFGDAVWDAPVAEGALHESDIVFGSGGRLAGDEVVFVPSVAMIDRLQWFEDDNAVWVSNSLVALLASTDASVAPLYPHYPRFFESVIRGIDRYRRSLDTSRGPVRLTYFRNLRVGGHGEPSEEMKPRRTHALDSYEAYRQFIEDAIGRLAANAGDVSRTTPLSLLGTVSSGFDSPAAAALARGAGLREAFTIPTARGGKADSGEEIGRRLGLDMHLVERDAWQRRPLIETRFLASDAKGEDVYFGGAGELLRHRLVLTGFGATTLWGRVDRANLDLHRSDQSGLSLTEFRLHAGFVNVPVPAIGAIYHDRILAMQRSPEMGAWSRNGSYDKPFARRVLHEAGIPDDLYGQGFKAASVLFSDGRSFLSPASRAAFEAFLGEARAAAGRRPAWLDAADAAGRLGAVAARGAQRAAAMTHRAWSVPLFERIVESERVGRLANPALDYRYLFPWAVEHTLDAYR